MTAFTPARIVALALVALSVLGLVALAATRGDDRVSVPAGAQAGDLILDRCTYDTEDGGYPADCGTLVVPENRLDPRSRLIALPVTRIRARSADARVPVFRLQGGPGITNTTFPEASRLAGGRDVVLVGYRGVDGSSRLDCPEVESALERSTDLLSERSFRERGDAFRACAERLTGEGVDLAGYTLRQRVDDLEAARTALGYGPVDLLSESAGTRTAMIYAWRHPASIRRSVMLGVNPPGHFVWDARTTDEQLRRYAALCADDPACRRKSPDLAASLRSASGHIPGHWWFLPVKEGNVRAAAFFGLMNATTDGAGPLAAPWTIDTLLAADRGDGGGAWFLSLLAQVAFPGEQVWGDVAAVGRSDASRARRLFADRGDRGSILGIPGTDLVWAGGRLLDAWPAAPGEDAYARVRDSDVETLLVSGELDVATPPQWARELLPHLPNGHEVVLRGFGHTDDFWTRQTAAGTRLITAFLDGGRVDATLYRPAPVDFTPVFSHGAIAEIVLGAMLGLAALALLSLVWMALRVRWRGGFGRKSSAVLRAAYPVVLGLGGWCLGVLVVLATMPAVALDDELLAALSIGAPVGLGVFLAWIGRDSAGATGLAAAVAGALLGAWLGFGVTEGLPAVGTTIAGAITGSNLVLLGLDVVRDRVAAGAAEPLEPRPSVG
jgi:pimeloyl-ACP methyl ester carboxylesterase